MSIPRNIHPASSRPVCWAALLLFLSLVPPPPAQACFLVVAGRQATADGSVIMGHNEDDGGLQVVHHFQSPRQDGPPDARYAPVLDSLGVLPTQTAAHFHAEMPGMAYSDAYLNEWGVCIASDGCPSRETHADLTDGGIGKDLRRLVALYAHSAREGVLLAGRLIEHFGYQDGGRTYAICDARQGWIFCVVRGQHWLAQRVPDDQVALVANTFTVRQVNLADPNNFLACPDLIDYAVRQGWHHPKEDGPFDFVKAYGHSGAHSHPSNVGRKWAALRRIAAQPFARQPDLPFAVRPKNKLGVADVMALLRDHYRGDDPNYDGAREAAIGHWGGSDTVCNRITQTSFVAQLRADLPADLGLVYWVTLAPPCTSAYVPVHFGGDFPPGYARAHLSADEYFRQYQAAGRLIDPNFAFGSLTAIHAQAGAVPVARLRATLDQTTARTLAEQAVVEKQALALYPADRSRARTLLRQFTARCYLKGLADLKEIRAEAAAQP